MSDWSNKMSDCVTCGNGPINAHAGLCVMGHPKVGDLVKIPSGHNPGMFFICEILPDRGYSDRTLFKGTRQGPIVPCDEDFMTWISS